MAKTSHRIFYALLLCFAFCVYGDELGPGQYLSRQVFPDCGIGYELESLNAVKMSVYLVDQDGYDMFISTGLVLEYFEECSCVEEIECDVDCQTPPVNDIVEDKLWIIVTHQLLQTAEYNFIFIDSCVIMGLIAIFGVFGFIIICSIVACCCCCCCCGAIGLALGITWKIQANKRPAYTPAGDTQL